MTVMSLLVGTAISPIFYAGAKILTEIKIRSELCDVNNSYNNGLVTGTDAVKKSFIHAYPRLCC